METYIALLRGINVSGQKKIKMAELREQLTGLGLTAVQTYIQSGNIVFSPELPAAKQEAIQRIGMGSYEKIVLKFPEIFWPTEPHRLNGAATSSRSSSVCQFN